jgi:hypothetical protein
VHDWKSGEQTGIKTTEVLDIKPVGGVPYYVVKVGELHQYYTMDLRSAFFVSDSKVQVRMVPPHPLFAWPLEAGRRWTHSGTLEDQQVKRQLNDRFGVLAREQIEVPAGRFMAFKIVREGEGRDGDQYWYVPEIRFYARWVGRRGDVEFEETLREFRAAPAPLLPPPSATAPVPR